jgi:RNA polymerase sigma factor (sigma-70 family)
VVSRFRLSKHDAEDAVAATYFRLAEHLGDIREPERLPGWLAVTARHEALAVIRVSNRSEPSSDSGDLLADDVDYDVAMIRSELRLAVERALERLSPNCQRLLRLLLADPPATYQNISQELGWPHGAIGPTRRRCLDKMRQMPELQPFLDDLR